MSCMQTLNFKKKEMKGTYVFKLNNVWMVKRFKNAALFFKFFLFLLVFSGKHFYSQNLFRWFKNSLKDLTK
jgi:hypothetical protein